MFVWWAFSLSSARIHRKEGDPHDDANVSRQFRFAAIEDWRPLTRAFFERPRLFRGSSLKTPVIAEVIRTERLVLRPHVISDSDRWFEIQSDPKVRAYTSWSKRTREESRRHLGHRTHHRVLKQAEDFLALAVEHDGLLIGDVALHLRSIASVTRAVEISWILHPDHQGQGFAVEAARAMLDVAFTRLEARFVYALIHPDNAPSAALARKLGFTLLVEGTGDDENVFVATGMPRD